MRLWLIASLWLCASAAGWACGVCMDQHLSIYAPFTLYTPFLSLGWFAAAALIRGFAPAAGDSRSLLPSGKGLFRIALFGSLGFLILLVITSGSAIGSSFVVSLAVALLVLGWTLEFALKAIWHRPGDKRLWLHFALNLLYLFLLVGAVPFSYVQAQTTPSLIRKLHYDFPDKGEFVLPALIAKGEAAVPPLIAAMKRSLAEDSTYGKMNAATSVAYCLGKIGGQAAAAYLGEVVNHQVDFTGNYDNRVWQRAACFAYGESAGGKAAPDLIALYQRLTSEQAQSQRWIVLVALVKTQSHAGLAFVFEHMDVLLDGADGDGDGGQPDVSTATTKVLLTQKSPDAIKNIPIEKALRQRGLRSPDQADTAAPSDIRQTWAASGEAIRQHWLTVLP